MYASLSRFLSMKGAGNIAASTARTGGDSTSLAATLPTAFLMPQAPHGCEFPAVLHCSGQAKQECNTKSKRGMLRMLAGFSWKKSQAGTVLFFFPLYYVSPYYCCCPSRWCWEKPPFVGHVTPLLPPIPHCNLAVYPHWNVRFLALLQSWT